MQKAQLRESANVAVVWSSRCCWYDCVERVRAQIQRRVQISADACLSTSGLSLSLRVTQHSCASCAACAETRPLHRSMVTAGRPRLPGRHSAPHPTPHPHASVDLNIQPIGFYRLWKVAGETARHSRYMPARQISITGETYHKWGSLCVCARKTPHGIISDPAVYFFSPPDVTPCIMYHNRHERIPTGYGSLTRNGHRCTQSSLIHTGYGSSKAFGWRGALQCCRHTFMQFLLG